MMVFIIWHRIKQPQSLIANGFRSTQAKIKHKLMGSDANLRYGGGKGRPYTRRSIAKDGFVHRSSLVGEKAKYRGRGQANDFAIAEFHAPGLKGAALPSHFAERRLHC